jgi:hypothetical protein
MIAFACSMIGMKSLRCNFKSIYLAEAHTSFNNEMQFFIDNWQGIGWEGSVSSKLGYPWLKWISCILKIKIYPI